MSELPPEMAEAVTDLSRVARRVIDYACALVPVEDLDSERAMWLRLFGQRLDRNMGGFPRFVEMMIEELVSELDDDEARTGFHPDTTHVEWRAALDQLHADLCVATEAYRAAMRGQAAYREEAFR